MSDGPRPGQRCEECPDGYLVVYAGVDRRLYRWQYLWCVKCHARPLRNKIKTPIEEVLRRKRVT